MKRGRKAFRNLNSKQLRRRTRKIKESLGIGKHRRYETLICNECKRENKIHLNKETIINDEVRKTYVCIFCKGKRIK